MSFIYPSIPSPRSKIVELADFMELQCLRKRDSISLMEIQRTIQRSGDELLLLGVDSEDDELEANYHAISDELQRREKACLGKYPFLISYSSISLKPDLAFSSYVYLYLLLATRLNMQTTRVFSGIDATMVFEELSTLVSQFFFGNRAIAINIGTSLSEVTFKERITALIALINEGGYYRPKIHGPIYEKDGKLDLVVIIPFSDKQPSSFIGFGQCKTGTTWRNHKSDLHPTHYCKKWFYNQPSFDPIRMFFVAEIEDPNIFYNTAVDTGLFFDRCRIIDYLPETFDDSQIEKLRPWTESALKFVAS